MYQYYNRLSQEIQSDVRRRISACNDNKEKIQREFVSYFGELKKKILEDLRFGQDMEFILNFIEDVADMWFNEADIDVYLVEEIADAFMDEVECGDYYMDDFVVGSE